MASLLFMIGYVDRNDAGSARPRAGVLSRREPGDWVVSSSKRRIVAPRPNDALRSACNQPRLRLERTTGFEPATLTSRTIVQDPTAYRQAQASRNGRLAGLSAASPWSHRCQLRVWLGARDQSSQDRDAEKDHEER